MQSTVTWIILSMANGQGHSDCERLWIRSTISNQKLFANAFENFYLFACDTKLKLKLFWKLNVQTKRRFNYFEVYFYRIETECMMCGWWAYDTMYHLYGLRRTQMIHWCCSSTSIGAAWIIKFSIDWFAMKMNRCSPLSGMWQLSGVNVDFRCRIVGFRIMCQVA